MATLQPFQAVRPLPEYVQSVVAPPYDVVSTEEARRIVEDNPKSFLHVARPEVDLAPGTDPHEKAVYEQGAANLRRFVGGDYTLREEEPSLYLYQLETEQRAQTGIFGGVTVQEYDDGTIVRHEATRPAKEKDRTRHILSQRAHAEPVMLTFRDDKAVHTAIREVTANEDPLYEVETDDGVRHVLWKVPAPMALVDAFQDLDRLYIADGHHRCKAASRAAAHLRSSGTPDGKAAFEVFPAVLFPMGDMHIMAYNRVIRTLPTSPAEFLNRLEERFSLERTVEDPVPDQKGVVCLYLEGAWHRLALPASGGAQAVDQLDVARLGEYVLEPMLGVTDPRRDRNIDFVGGIRGTDALERRVDDGEAELAISMHPTQIEELIAVADEGNLMPPKSTWFEPKLRSGFLVHDFSDDVPEVDLSKIE